MSYDLLVYDRALTPRDQKQFVDWYSEQMNADDRPYDSYDPATTSAKLRAFYEEMRRTFPR